MVCYRNQKGTKMPSYLLDGMPLKTWLTEHKITMRRFARMLGIHQNTMFTIVNGVHAPRPKLMKAIHDATDGEIRPCDFYKFGRPKK